LLNELSRKCTLVVQRRFLSLPPLGGGTDRKVSVKELTKLEILSQEDL
jgi:hypothetical protein